MKDKYFPVSLHVNYVKAKTLELQSRGLWLITEDEQSKHTVNYLNLTESRNSLVCQPYNILENFYSTYDWISMHENIMRRRDELYNRIMINGTLVKSYSRHGVYFIDHNKTRHLISNKDLFEELGFDWDDIISIPTSILNQIHEGEPL